METTTTEVEIIKDVVIPDGFPDAVFQKVQSQLKAEPHRSLAFQNEKQRNAAFIQKGLSKPGKISYDVLRRTANSVHIARICINTLKEKITKTKWVIQPIDQLKKVDQTQIDKVTELLRYPNPTDSFRTLLDKMLEDLLVLDAVSLEKTRFPNGELAQLYFVDSATIRPVFNEYGVSDIEIPLKTEKEGNTTLPVSYVQILNNSQYGGPESGDIIAAWPKRDFIYFHQHPQGAMDAFGYGLSPLEGVVSVVANILNADNYNSTYFEEGAFPPVIIQLIGTVNQRDLEAYREYMNQELTGNFHRPAIMATKGADGVKIHNLKDLTNNDMQFMDYMMFLARLLCAAYGMSGQDIGLTDEVGSKNVSETQKDLSEGKGYGSILTLLKEQFNDIIWRDFGFKDIEFDWVAPDSTDPVSSSTIYDLALKNGTLTINEVRQKSGETPYDKWADEPMILTGNGYIPVIQEPEDTEVSQGERPVEKMQKGTDKTLYLYRTVENSDEIIEWAKSQGFGTTMPSNEMHVTIAYSKIPVNWKEIGINSEKLTVEDGLRTIEELGDKGAIVLRFESSSLTNRWKQIMHKGGSWDFDSYRPHITISYNGGNINIKNVRPYTGKIIFKGEKKERIDENWHDDIIERTQKAIYTPANHKTWADDRGYSQPFIYMNILSGTGMVIKPPVAVNLESQQLEQDITSNLSLLGLNVCPVRKMTLVQVKNMLSNIPDVYTEFERYISMTAEYDSEKWRSKFGGSRQFAYYLVSDYIDGMPLSNPLMIADMKRDPDSYKEAIKDLADLWKVEKDMLLGDRRIDQYLITHDKRAYGIDYQFKGDFDRWERNQDIISETLSQVPELQRLFNSEKSKQDTVIKRIIKNVRKVYN